MTTPASADELRARILALVGEYHQAAFAPRPFVAGETPVPVSRKVFDGEELRAVVDAGLEFWLTTGRYAAQFEKAFARLFGLRAAMLVNSGSSANLVAVTALTSPLLGDRRLVPGDEVVTVAAGFPTTIAPILQNGLVPVFVDITAPTYNVDASQLEAAWSPRTRAVILAHTLGNPFDLAAVTRFVERHGLFLIEDCCDALGSTYGGKPAGSFGDLATASFYPAHHITMGEGGCVLTDRPLLKRICESVRDWGRDCWCDPGKDDTCGKRFEWQLGDLPAGYDHKYSYTHLGYNLKLTDLQAAVGVAQLGKLDGFIAARRANFRALHEGLRELEDWFVLPEATPGSDPSWFGFPLALRPAAPLDRNAVIRFLESRKIVTRLLFAGNALRQPAFRDVPHRRIGDLAGADFAMNRVFWIGVHPGLTAEMLAYVVETFHALRRHLPVSG